MENQQKWWKTAVFYQIYPRSFADGNGDGIGDLYGIIQKLDYLQDLGIDAIWLSPHYPSPLFDGGYDVTNYTDVAPEYGNLETFDEFLSQAHRRSMRVVIDFVLNHTSDQHPWFIESRSSRDHPKRDWYIWRDGRIGGPPNNWCADFEDSAWEFDPLTDQYYYHFFFHTQPDLNWRNPQVKNAIMEAMRFWLLRGVDGFRLDAVDTIFEDPNLADHNANISHAELYHLIKSTYPALPSDPYLAEQRRTMYEKQQLTSETHILLKEIRDMVNTFPDRVLIGETDDISFYGNGSDELDLLFNFPLMRIDQLTPAWIRSNQRQWLSRIPDGAWYANTLGNHDTPRIASRFHGFRSNHLHTLAAIPLLLLGTPFLYNGEEIGMTDNHHIHMNEFQDNLAIWMYQNEIERFQASPSKAHEAAIIYGRDKSRTPMQWTRQPNAGFCPVDVQPWLPINPNYIDGCNVEEQVKDPSSLYSIYRSIISLRKNHPALTSGTYQALLTENPDCLAFLRRIESETCLVLINMHDSPLYLSASELPTDLEFIFSSDESTLSLPINDTIDLHPFEVRVAVVSNFRHSKSERYKQQ